jgi:hypothetical protein
MPKQQSERKAVLSGTKWIGDEWHSIWHLLAEILNFNSIPGVQLKSYNLTAFLQESFLNALQICDDFHMEVTTIPTFDSLPSLLIDEFGETQT